MVEFYVKRIQAGKKTLDEVPALWYDAVKARLIELGLYTEDTDGGNESATEA